MPKSIDKSYFMQEMTGIRVCLNSTQLLTNKHIKIESICIQNVGDLGNIYTPWCKNDSNLFCNWDCSSAKPMSVKIASEFDNFPDHIAKDFDYHKKQYEKCIPADIRFPVYQLPDNKFLLLDGNHRSVEVFKAYNSRTSSVFHPIELWVICGPVDQTILPDLIHWK